jgi:hypothetical protein
MAGFPTGVEIHNGKLRISFKFKNIRCREVLQGGRLIIPTSRKLEILEH